MASAASLMLGLIHLVLWLKAPREIVYPLSAIMAFSASAEAMIELAQMKSQSIAAYATLLQWQNMAVYILLLSMVWVVYHLLGTARRWLAVLITLLWSISIVINFLSPYSLVYSNIEALRYILVFGDETYAQAYGQTHPWKLLADISSFLILFYFLDAAIRSWKKADRRRALVIGGGTTLFILFGGIHAGLVDAAVIETPYMISFAFLTVVMAMSYELLSDALEKSYFARRVAAEEKRWSTLMENIHLAVIGIDLEGRIIYGNPFFLHLLGFPSGEILGSPAADIIHPDQKHEFLSRLARMPETGPRDHSEWMLVDRRGKEHLLACSSVLQKSDDDQVIGILTVAEDVTEKREIENELRKAQNEMERMSRVNILGELASALAHELNQPLAAILSNAQAAKRFFLKDPPDLDEVHEILDDIVRDDKRAGEIIHGMRAMFRKREPKREMASPNRIVEEAVNLVRGEFDKQQISIELQLANDLPEVFVSNIEIQQVVMNLLLNAERAMEGISENRQVTVSTGWHEDAVEIVVYDHGNGIPAADIERIFEPFMTTKSEGIGMGLAISRRIIKTHGGEIKAENLPGRGARFSLTLPAA